MIEEYINSLNERAEQANKDNSDYTQDGIVFCGICHTPKQSKINLLDSERIVWHMCKCQCEKEKAIADGRILSRKVNEAIGICDEIGFNWYEVEQCSFEKDNGKNPQLIGAVKEYVDNFDKYMKSGKGLLLYGTVGTGKSYAATCAVNALVRKGIPAAITNFAQISNGASETFNKQSYFKMFNKLALLVIDELSVQRDSSYMIETVHAVIDERCRIGLPMIVTANYTMEELKNTPDIAQKRIISRVLGSCHPIEVRGADQRVAKAREEYKDIKKELGA